MKIIYITIFLFALSIKVILADAPPEMITLSCPAVTAIYVSKINEPSWALYEYTAFVSVQLPALDNKLALTGKGMAAQVSLFQAATWTDHTFLCNYNSGLNAAVMFETQLSLYVKRCYFKAPGIFECLSTDPSQCILTCELGQSAS